MGMASSINFVCQGDVLSKVPRSYQVSNLRPEKLSCFKMPENWLVKSDYNSKWVTGAWAEARVVCGLDFKMLRKLCLLGQIRS